MKKTTIVFVAGVIAAKCANAALADLAQVEARNAEGLDTDIGIPAVEPPEIELGRAVGQEPRLDQVVDMSRPGAAHGARLGLFPLEGDGALPARRRAAAWAADLGRGNKKRFTGVLNRV